MTTDNINTEPTAEERKRASMVQGLRDLADFLEASPDVPLPYEVACNVWQYDEEDMTALARIPGEWQKTYRDTSFKLQRNFGEHVHYAALCERQLVCTAKKVGTHMVERTDYSNVPKVMVEEDIIEWECHPLLAPTKKVNG